ncbi:PF07603 family protein [Leptospira fainei serovar Hurstbridge str. BUT 6]|uniref:PF07603 family protein n=2 Tax=Leptospira fainei TaxID=48782 RepID=S3W1X5_9LEPT|nr:PF07603 family protein [Leptospira fainei serovar Hurstbridge str. BUT 6]
MLDSGKLSVLRFGFWTVVWILFCGVFSDVFAQTARFTVNANNASVINDNVTKLYWQKCIYPYSYSSTATPAGCQKNASYPGSVTLTFSNASSYCSNYNSGSVTWRLPSIQELKSIVDRSQFAPALNSIFDPGQASSGSGVPDFFWSSTKYAQNNGNIWTVNFYYGYSYFTAGSGNSYYLRCVSSTPQ